MNTPLLQIGKTGIKVCGLRTEEDVDTAVGAGANAVGFMFVESSPRYIDRHEANQLALQLPDDVLAVAVVQDYDNLADFSDWNGWLQLCGEEDENKVTSAPKPVIRAFQWNLDSALRWDKCKSVEALLVDGSTGGLGQTFDVSKLATVIPSLTKPLIIAGGLTPENVAGIIEEANPTAVDVSSGIESTKGIKDHQKMCDFINAVRATDRI
jgi:phosphoribosylanthranilate isomerase